MDKVLKIKHFLVVIVTVVKMKQFFVVIFLRCLKVAVFIGY